MSDIRVPLDPIFDAFGVPAVVTRPDPDQTPIDTSVIWVDGPTDEFFGAIDMKRRSRRKVLTLRLDQVPRVPTGTLIEAPEQLGEVSKVWRVEEQERIEVDQVRVVVIEEPS